MKVVDHAPHHWFLLDDAGVLLLDANCSHGAVGYDFLVALTPEETAEYRRQGREYLGRLATAIHDSVPIAAATASAYRGRNLAATHGERVMAAIVAWRAGG